MDDIAREWCESHHATLVAIATNGFYYMNYNGMWYMPYAEMN